MYKITKDKLLLKELSNALAFYHAQEKSVKDLLEKEQWEDILSKLREETLIRIEQIINN